MKLTREIRDLKEYKESNGLTYKELSETIDISVVTLNQWILGSVKPTTQSLTKVRKFLKHTYKMQEMQQVNTNVTLDSRLLAKGLKMEHYNLLKMIRKSINYLERMQKDFNTINTTPVKIDGCKNPYSTELYFIEDKYINPSTTQEIPFYHVTIKGCELVAHKMTGYKGTKFTVMYINEFHKLSEQDQKQNSNKIVSNIFNQSFNTPNQEPQQTELLQDESSELTPLQQDMNYLQQRINRLKEIKDLDQLSDELDTVTKLSQFMKIEHKLDE